MNQKNISEQQTGTQSISYTHIKVSVITAPKEEKPYLKTAPLKLVQLTLLRLQFSP